MANSYAIGLDYGTNSVRALVVDTANGAELGTHVFSYPHGEAGIILDPNDPNAARQHPQDYLDGAVAAIRGALDDATKSAGFDATRIVGLGVDTTGSTPIPLNAEGVPLALTDAFKDHPAAMAWLWKDHTGHAEAAEITQLAARQHPEYLAKCGGGYSSEWFWSKLLRCARVAPKVFNAAHTWVEHADWMPAILCGITAPAGIKRCICAAGHKAMFHPDWGGYPSAEFLGALDPGLARVRATLPNTAYAVGHVAGRLTAEWAARLGLPEGTPVSAGAFDAHLGAVGSGIGPGVLVKIIGTSACDIMTAPLAQAVPDIPGLCGIVPESVLPGAYGFEAGQSAVGDLFNWFVNVVQPGNGSHESLTLGAEQLKPGESGLLALDWNNGNRTILIDPRLTGLMLGMTLHSTPAEIYRALVEATAFGARTIIGRLEEYGVQVDRIVCCGGISAKSRMVMQIYADVTGRPMEISRSAQTCALGAAMAGAVAGGAHPDFAAASAAMTAVQETRFEPIPANAAVYDRLYGLYRRLHDLFGATSLAENQFDVMKTLLAIRDEARGA
ncbi:MAG: ribulokinase [Candidatus Hydrogenedentes bacterium]|nr:ribulokinase [Candidatus Hydrogenedentota bacterium]